MLMGVLSKKKLLTSYDTGYSNKIKNAEKYKVMSLFINVAIYRYSEAYYKITDWYIQTN